MISDISIQRVGQQEEEKQSDIAIMRKEFSFAGSFNILPGEQAGEPPHPNLANGSDQPSGNI